MASVVTQNDESTLIETTDQDGIDDLDEFINGLSAISFGGENNEKLQKALMKICRDGLEDRLNVLLKHGVDVEGRDGDGRTGLMWACQCGHRNIVDLLIKSGANVDSSDNEEKSSLMIASEHGHEQVVELILKYVSDIDVMNAKGYTALVFACENGNENIVNLLIDHGADFNSEEKGSLYASPIFNAINKRRSNIVQLLINRGVNLERKDRLSPLIHASGKEGCEDIVELLLQNGANIHATWAYGSAVTECWHGGDTDILEILLKHGANANEGIGEDDTLLMTACRFEDENVVEILLKYGADVNATDREGTTALMVSTCLARSKNHDVKIAELLLRNAANVNAKDSFGCTALMFAAGHERVSLLKLFLHHGASIDSAAVGGKTAVMCSVQGRALNCFNILVNAGASLELMTVEGYSILSYALKNRECLEILIITLEKGDLLKDGKLKHIYKTANYERTVDEAVVETIRLGFFEWEFCVFPCKKTCVAALRSGYCPGKLNCSLYKDMKVSPLIAAFLDNDTELIETYLKCRYYFPEDYRLLATNDDLRSRISESSPVDKFTLQPLSLFTWSFLTVSKAISLTGHHTSRRQRVETLLIPDSMKKVLAFQIMDCR